MKLRHISVQKHHQSIPVLNLLQTLQAIIQQHLTDHFQQTQMYCFRLMPSLLLRRLCTVNTASNHTSAFNRRFSIDANALFSLMPKETQHRKHCKRSYNSFQQTIFNRRKCIVFVNALLAAKETKHCKQSYNSFQQTQMHCFRLMLSLLLRKLCIYTFS